MANVAIEGHPLIGREFVYHSNENGYAPMKLSDITTATIVGNGMVVRVLEVFANWNDVEGLAMLYVKCPATGYNTHVTPLDVGWDKGI